MSSRLTQNTYGHAMSEQEKREFHRFIEYLLKKYDNDDIRCDFESFILVLHNLIGKEYKDFSLGLIIEQLIYNDVFVITIPHYGVNASLKTMSWLQRRFYEELYNFMVFSLGADHFGNMDLSKKDLTNKHQVSYYEGVHEFYDHKCYARLSGSKVSLIGEEMFLTSILVSIIE